MAALGEPLHVRVVVLDHEVAKRRRNDKDEQRRVCDEQLRGRKLDKLWDLEVILLGRFEQPPPIGPVLIHYRVLRESRLPRLRQLEAYDRVREDLGQHGSAVERVFVVQSGKVGVRPADVFDCHAACDVAAELGHDVVERIRRHHRDMQYAPGPDEDVEVVLLGFLDRLWVVVRIDGA